MEPGRTALNAHEICRRLKCALTTEQGKDMRVQQMSRRLRLARHVRNINPEHN
jgi:hypothetical protein